MDEHVTLVASDGTAFSRPCSEVRQCDTVSGVLLDTGETTFQCPCVAPAELERVCAWCKEHPDIRNEPDKPDQLSDWEVSFFSGFPGSAEEQLEATKRLFAAANYLGAAVLTRHCALALTVFVSQRSPEQVRELFGLELLEDPADVEELARLLGL